MKKKEEEEKDNDEWVPSVILSGIGLEAQIWVLLLELKQKSGAPRNRGSTQIKSRGLVLRATAGVALTRCFIYTVKPCLNVVEFTSIHMC
jgi:hypothetical protein